MCSAAVSSDGVCWIRLRVAGPLDVKEMAGAIEVTATAVRQRLSRMLARGLIEREAIRAGRGRPRHRYHLTERGLELTGSNFPDLAMSLWNEITSIKNEEVRTDLLRRIARSLAQSYLSEIKGETLAERMASLSELFAKRRIPFSVEVDRNGVPVLTARACPYPRLADQDRQTCTMEEMLFTELLGQDVELKNCRLEGDCTCQFQAK